MAVEIGVDIRPDVKISDVRKAADIMTHELDEQLKKYSNTTDKGTRALNKQAEKIIDDLQDITSVLEKVASKKYEFKFGEKIAANNKKIEATRKEIALIDKQLAEFGQTTVGKKVAQEVATEFIPKKKDIQEKYDEAHKQVVEEQKKLSELEVKYRAAQNEAQLRADNKKKAEAKLKEQEKFERKNRARIDRERAERPTFKKSPNMVDQSDVDLWKRNVAQESAAEDKALEDMERLEKEIETQKQALSDAADESAKYLQNLNEIGEEESKIAQARMQETTEYQKKILQKEDKQQKIEDLEQTNKQLSAKDAKGAEEFAEKTDEAMRKMTKSVAQNLDKGEVALIKYAEQEQKTSNKTSDSAKKTSDSIKGIKNISINVFGAMQKGFKSAVVPLRQFTRYLKPINFSFGKIMSQLKRSTGILAGFILGTRGLYTLINRLRSAVLGGFKDIYNQDDKFKKQVDTIKQQLLDIKVAFAKAFMPIVQMAIPYVKQLLDWVLSLLGAVSTFISSVTGVKAYTKAIKGLGGAAASTNKQLSKLDELNNLSSDSGNGLTPDAGTIGDTEPIEDWFTFTRNIIDEVEKLLRAIPWDDIYEKAEKLGEIAGQIINGVLSPSFWESVGQTLAGVLNTILHFLSSLGETINFEDLGKSILAAIRGILDTFDWELLSTTIETWADGFWRTIKTILTDRDVNNQTLIEKLTSMLTNALKKIDWEKIHAKVDEIARTLADSFNQLLNPELFRTIGETLGGIVTSIVQLAFSFGDEFDFENFATAVSNGIKGFLETFQWGLLGQTINTWVEGFFDFIETLFGDKQLWQDMFDAAIELVGNIDIKKLSILLGGLALVNSRTWLRDALGTALTDTLGTSALTLAEIGIVFSGFYLIGNYAGMIDALLTGNEEDLELYKEANPFMNGGPLDQLAEMWFEDWIENFQTNTLEGKLSKKLGEKLGEFIGKTIVGAKIVWQEEWKPGLEEAGAKWEEFWDTTFSFYKDIFTNIKTIWQDTIDFWSDPVEKSGLEGALENLYTNAVRIISNIKSLFASIKNYFIGGGQQGSTVGMPEDIKKQLGLDKTNSFQDDIKEIGTNIIQGILKGMTDESGHISLKALFDNFVIGLKNIFDTHSPSERKEIKDIGKDIVLGIVNGFSLVNFSKKMTDWWNKNIAPWFKLEKWNTLVQPIKDSITTVWEDTVEFWTQEVPKWWNEHVAPWFTLEKWQGIVQNIKNAIVNKWTETMSWWRTNINSWWTENVAPWFTLEKWQGIVQNIKNAIVNKWTEMVNWWRASISSWWSSHVAPWFTLEKWQNLFLNIKNALVNKWNEAVSWFKTAVSNILSNAQNTLTYSAFSTIGTNIGNGIKNAFKTAIDSMTTMWNNLKTLVAGGLSMKVKVETDTSEASKDIADLTGQAIDFGQTAVAAGTALQQVIPTTTSTPKDTKKTPGTYTSSKTSSAGASLPADIRKKLGLASGSVIPPSMMPYVAVLGDNNHETEVVSPLSTMKRAFAETMMEMNGSFGGAQTINLVVDGEVLARTIVKQDDLTRMSKGTGLFGI